MEEALRPLTDEERGEAVMLGLGVTKCVSCGQPTLYSLDVAVQPRTCGRMPCMQMAREHLRYRRRE